MGRRGASAGAWTLVWLVVAIALPSVANALTVDRAPGATIVTVVDADTAQNTSSASSHLFASYGRVPGANDSWEGWPLLQVAPDLLGGGWHACDYCGASVAGGELVFRLSQPSIITVEDAGRLPLGPAPLRIRIEATTAGAASGSAIRLHFDNGDATRDDTVVVSGRTIDVNGDGVVDIDATTVKLRAFELWTGAGNDTVDARTAAFGPDITSWLPSSTCCDDGGIVNLGDGNDSIRSPERLGGEVALGAGNDTAVLDRWVHSEGIRLTTDGGTDVVDGSASTSNLDVAARSKGTLRVTTAARWLTLKSHAESTWVDARRGRGSSIGVTSATSNIRTGAGVDDVAIWSGSKVAQVDLGAGPDRLAARGATVSGTLGAGVDIVRGLPASWITDSRLLPAPNLQRLSCGAGTDHAEGRRIGPSCERRHKELPRAIAFHTQHYFEDDRDSLIGWLELAGRPSRFIGASSEQRPEQEHRYVSGYVRTIPVAASENSVHTLRPGPDVSLLAIRSVVRDGRRAWECTGCPAPAPGVGLRLQLQHPTRVDLWALAAGMDAPPIVVETVGRRAGRSSIRTRWRGATQLTASGWSLQEHGRELVRVAGQGVYGIAITTSTADDVIDLRGADPHLAWGVDAGSGVATVHGSPWSDSIVARGSATIHGGAGNDSITARNGSRLWGDDGDDNLRATGPSISMFGGAGNDNLVGRQGSRILDGGPGSDRIEAGGGRDVIRGGSGDDWIHKYRGKLRVWGGPGNDWIHPKRPVTTTFADCGTGVDSLRYVARVHRGCDHLDASLWYDQRYGTFFEAGKTTLTEDDPHFEALPKDALD